MALARTLQCRNHCYSHFTEEETEARRAVPAAKPIASLPVLFLTYWPSLPMR